MKLPITKYGTREILLLLALAVLTVLLGHFFLPQGYQLWLAVIMATLLVLVLAFFRDPQRAIPDQPNILLGPADGRVTDIIEVDENEFLNAPAIRIGIFLSVTDVHINRIPCQGIVRYVQSHPGKCINAMRSQAASQFNQSNCLGLECEDHPAKKIMVKQITGAIARRIVCTCKIGDKLEAGQRFGMIKLGSRTELYIPVDKKAQILVKKGDKVRAGATILVKYISTSPIAEKA